MYVSFDDGDHWQSLQLNLPTTSFRDVVIKDNDLVVGTYGRGIWILDDISPLRQMTAAIANEPAHLFKPGDAVRVRRNVEQDTPFPPEVPHALNPPERRADLLLARQQAVGRHHARRARRVRRGGASLSSAPITPVHEAARPPEPNFWLADAEAASRRAAGTNRVNWDLRYDESAGVLAFVRDQRQSGTDAGVAGGSAGAARHVHAQLTVDGKTYSQTVMVRNDPRSPATPPISRRSTRCR